MPNANFRRFAWFYLAYLLFVILFGAWVRISGSGNGCGSHWPTCNGEVVPQEAAAKTLIEYSHRITSGLCGIFGIILLVWARRVNRRATYAAAAALFFVLVEGFIGAVLVKKELVADNDSVARAVVISLHLANTLLLTASAATAAWWAGGEQLAYRRPASRALLSAAILALVLTNMTGAVTALGDTLFPVESSSGGVAARLAADLSAGQHFLVRLRILHPVIAILSAGVVLMAFAGVARGNEREGPLGQLLDLGQIIMVIQLVMGGLNVVLAAPGWMQILHLLAAQIVWLAAWLVTISAWPRTAPVRTAPAVPMAAGTH